MSWITEFKHTSRGVRLFVFKFEGFAEIHCTKNETIMYQNGQRVIIIDGDIKVSVLEVLQNRVEEAYDKLKEFHHDDN